MTTPLPEVVQVYRALGHPARVRILAILRAGELCVCQITAVLRLAPSTVSAHLAELRRAELIAERKEGRWVHYRLADSELAHHTSVELWQRVRRDPQIKDDAAVVKQIRSVTVEELCRADLDITSVTRATGTA
jgi:DNA-binding transcriptional ArsR family regulator